MVAYDKASTRGFNPRTPCEVRLSPARHSLFIQVSIHAPLARCDHDIKQIDNEAYSFNPRTPCEVRLIDGNFVSGGSRFQSTHPLRGATPQPEFVCFLHLVSIHAPLARCDHLSLQQSIWSNGFNPRTPCEVRLYSGAYTDNYLLFQSTHPLRGATLSALVPCEQHYRFNPRTPCEVRLLLSLLCLQRHLLFQSTHPLRGATG